ncbi:DUF2227 family putative metal-binding protein [Deinococcus multiflagellatus]|uniref:DUF2227 family putative metal-binding protein n=1 Tax=Deinococcus multiflagellatus TaxID=1656887 RepID=A0ABW1ZT39_9DEIO|nr:DUF2227 family putative metal-binding protein [Deinococcus multiflagellatus]MBZ9714398.1 metal-binding protein [Deinococcus multiflagellatus]
MMGWQHTALNLSVFAPLAGLGVWAGQDQVVLAVGAGYLIGTLYVTPDLDLPLNDAARRWGPLRFIWVPYHRLSRHRGMSHTYVLGPLIRLLYLAVLMWPLVALFRPEIDTGRAAQVLAGYLASQWLHLLADGYWPVGRRPRRTLAKRTSAP